MSALSKDSTQVGKLHVRRLNSVILGLVAALRVDFMKLVCI